MATTDPDKKRIAAEYRAMDKAIIRVNQAYAELDMHLSDLMNALISGPTKDTGARIYFSPDGSRVRHDILDAVYSPLFDNMHGYLLATPWTNFVKRLGKRRQSRNEIIHGQVVTITRKNKKYVRLTPILTDRAALEKAHDPKQVMGLSVGDVKTAAERIFEMQDEVAIYRDAITPLLKSDQPTLRQIHQKLEAHRKKAGTPSDPNCAAPPRPPQSFGA